MASVAAVRAPAVYITHGGEERRIAKAPAELGCRSPLPALTRRPGRSCVLRTGP